MGTTTSVNIVDEIIPPMIVQQSGDHWLVRASVRGTSPRMVVKVVNIIGLNLDWQP